MLVFFFLPILINTAFLFPHFYTPAPSSTATFSSECGDHRRENRTRLSAPSVFLLFHPSNVQRCSPASSPPIILLIQIRYQSFSIKLGSWPYISATHLTSGRDSEYRFLHVRGNVQKGPSVAM